MQTLNPAAESVHREDAGPVATPGERSAAGPLDAARGLLFGAAMGAAMWALILWAAV